MRPITAAVAACAFVVCVAACGGSSGQVLPPSSTAVSLSPTQSPDPTPSAAASPSPSPPAVPAQAPPPATRQVFFAGLPAGSYVTHLHSICNGSQSFHITVLGTLVVGAAGTGSIAVSSGYFGRGLCVIVYVNAALSRVLTTRPI